MNFVCDGNWFAYFNRYLTRICYKLCRVDLFKYPPDIRLETSLKINLSCSFSSQKECHSIFLKCIQYLIKFIDIFIVYVIFLNSECMLLVNDYFFI